MNRLIVPGVPTAQALVSNPNQPVLLRSATSSPAFGAFSVALPAGALAKLVSRLGPVTVLAQVVPLGSLTPAEQSAVRANSGNATQLLDVLVINVVPANGGLGTAGLHVQQAGGQIAISITLPDGVRCDAGSVLLGQVLDSGSAQILPGTLAADGKTPLTVSGTVTADLTQQRLVLFLVCLPPASSASPTPSPTLSPPPSPGAVIPSPASLVFTAIGDKQRFGVTQSNGSGKFSATNCLSGSKTVATVAPGSAGGSFDVTAAAEGTCTLTVTGDNQQQGQVTVNVNSTTFVIDRTGR